MKTNGLARAVLATGLSATAAAAGCAKVLIPPYEVPSVNSGWEAQLVAGGLTKPRSIEFDSSGALLVVESGKGLTRHKLTDSGGTCIAVSDSTLLISQTSTVYVSTVDAVYAWAYDADKGTVSATPRVIVNNMSNNDLVTRTLLISRKEPDKLVVSRGSSEGNEVKAAVLSSGLSQVRAFDLGNFTTTSKAYNFNTEGIVLGWGLRNSVGIGEHPVTGGIYGVENSVDGVTRNNKDIHENNPGEELNFFGFLNGTGTGGNYGYPHCFAVWEPTEIPDHDGLGVGDQFAVQENNTLTDEVCAKDYIAPRLTFPAHYAPLDIKFTKDGSEAFVSFHGSFDKTDPVGYRVGSLAFNPATGEPEAPADALNALTDIISNNNHNVCPGGCFRPAGLALDAAGRLWMTSDTTGEIYVLQKKAGSPTATASGTIVTATGAPSSGAGVGAGWGWEVRVLGWGSLVFVGGFLALV
ncbi:hypothetical protein B0H67DRAFT_307275 [Lasiosphaeris hirsuta]|uniref:Pyrroloquinoline quinone-dependent pyranose dehydrogenase beta-propeller domain-containing protein n=1 Tax=Lasiosphaeris hirsuta TaxID=260670 RepID=A0AA40A0W9_9PEZI|nr:hypothetical protein B0H67DRAFT_307275 [Lasiosphaeris hirsuta]